MGERIDLANVNANAWKTLAQQSVIQLGNTQIRKNDLGGTTNAIVDTINFIPEVLGSAVKNTAANIDTSNGSTLTQIVSSTSKNRFGIGIGSPTSALSSLGAVSSVGKGFFKNDTVDTAEPFNIGGAIGLNDGAVASAAESAAKAAEDVQKTVDGYLAPVTETLNFINKIGEEFDKIIKDTFLGQVFKIKGSEIICAVFCIIISLLPCKIRQQLYDAVMAIKDALNTINATLTGINQMTSTAVEVPLFNDKTIADNVKALLSNNGRNGDKFNNVPSGTGTKKPAILIEIPPGVKETVQQIITILSIIAKGQITLPVGINGNLWDLAQAILSVIQAMVVQLADELMTKVIMQLEAQLKKMMPQICIGNLAAIFINKIIEAILTLKNYLLEQLKLLFGDSEGFGIKWKTFGWYWKELQTLLAFLKALQLVLKNFPDLLLLCGLQPCKDPLPDSVQQMIQDAVRNGTLLNETNEPANVLPIEDTPTGKTLDELAHIFGPVKIIPNESGFEAVMPEMFKNAPKMIQDIINSPDFLNELGNAYTVYTSPDIPFVNIVYTYKLACGD